MDEDLKYWNFSLEGFEKGVQSQVIVEVDTLLPLSDESSGSNSIDYLGDCFCSNTEMIAETNTDDGVQT